MCAMTCQESSVPQSKELELPREMKQKIKKTIPGVEKVGWI